MAHPRRRLLPIPGIAACRLPRHWPVGETGSRGEVAESVDAAALKAAALGRPGSSPGFLIPSGLPGSHRNRWAAPLWGSAGSGLGQRGIGCPVGRQPTERVGGGTRNRTGDDGFAIRCLTTWPCRRVCEQPVRPLRWRVRIVSRPRQSSRRAPAAAAQGPTENLSRSLLAFWTTLPRSPEAGLGGFTGWPRRRGAGPFSASKKIIESTSTARPGWKPLAGPS